MTIETHPLDNPVWHSLDTRHRGHALGGGLARRYPAETAPFAAIPAPGAGAETDLLALLEPGERVVMVGVTAGLGPELTLQKEFVAYQYLWPEQEVEGSDVGVVPLSEEDIPKMLELTGLVYPAYFRPATARLGTYFGVFEEGLLCAMGGTRMNLDGYQELSAICTHPDHRGRGLAARISRRLLRHIRAEGDRAFLHTESDNLAAQSIYEKLGFELRARIPIRLLQREA